MAQDNEASRAKPAAHPAGAQEQDGAAGLAEAAGSAPCACHQKSTPRDIAFQDDLQKRLNRVIGQLNGVKGMIDDNRYCGDVLVQLAAVESAVRSISGKLLQDHLETCVVEQITAGNTEVTGEVMQLMRRFARL